MARIIDSRNRYASNAGDGDSDRPTEEFEMDLRPIRTFVSIELGLNVKSALADLIEGFRRAELRGVKLVRPEGIHLTLKFLGDVSEDRIESVVAALSRSVRCQRPFTLELGDLDVFPNRDTPMVFWIGLQGGMATLHTIRQRLEDYLEAQGFVRDRRSYRPHLTLARIKRGVGALERREVARELLSYPFKPGLRMCTDAVSLMKSTLMPDGAIYECLTSVPLEGS